MARHEAVRHLDDLLLRRTRLGLVAREGGLRLLPEPQPVVQAELNWSDRQWADEVERYRAGWQRTYAVPALDR